MSREIVYHETVEGHFEPQPTPYQRRKMREESQRMEQKRQDKLALWIYAPLAFLALFVWMLINFLLGGGWRYL